MKITNTEDGTYLEHTTYFKYKTYDNIAKLESDIEYEKDILNLIQENLIAFAVMTPDRKNLSHSDLISDIAIDIRTMLSDYRDTITKLNDLENLYYAMKYDRI